MNRSHFDSQTADLSAKSEAQPFHSNLHFQEVLATLGWGIVARKGLILLIGDAGTAKARCCINSRASWIATSPASLSLIPR